METTTVNSDEVKLGEYTFPPIHLKSGEALSFSFTITEEDVADAPIIIEGNSNAKESN